MGVFRDEANRVDLHATNGKPVTAVRESVKHAWQVMDPWGNWRYFGTSGEVSILMSERIRVFEAAEWEEIR